MSIRLKIILAMFAVTMAIALGATGMAYHLLQSSLAEEFRERLQDIAYLGVATLDVEATQRLVQQAQAPLTTERMMQIEQSADYRRLSDQLQRIRSTEPKLIQYAYILVPSNTKEGARFLVDADVIAHMKRQANGETIAEEISHFGLLYDTADKPMIRQAFSSKQLVVEQDFMPDPQYRTRSLSAYAPIVDGQGRYLGLLGVDLKDENMAQALATSRAASLLIVVVSLLAATLLSIYVGRRLTQGIRVLNGVVQRFADKHFEVRAPVGARDEVGHLSRSFNEMAQTIDSHAKHLEALLEAYGRFVPHSFLGFLQKESVVDLRLGDHVKREMTVLFSDIRGFTSLSESMSPRENFDFINAYLRRVGPVIREHGGVIDKYIGDAVMALFPDSVADAIRAGVDMQRRVEEYNEKRVPAGRPPIAIGVGVHTGQLILGTVGEDERMNSTVISDAVNLASRLEGVTKRYGARVVVSAATLDRLPATTHFGVRLLDKIQVKGKHEPVVIFEVLDADPEPLRTRKLAVLADWELATQHFYAARFAAAKDLFDAIAVRLPDDIPTQLFLTRIARALELGVADGWTGVDVLDSK